MKNKLLGQNAPKRAPERVIQFGEGNFLRAFADDFFDIAALSGTFSGSVVVVTPRSDRLVKTFNEQNCLYTLVKRGIQKGEAMQSERIVGSVSRCLDGTTQFESVLALAENENIRFIVSNTTEAGITLLKEDTFELPRSLPARIARLMMRRFETLGGCAAPGFIVLPCELIEENGEKLKALVIKQAKAWGANDDFFEWFEDENTFCDTLVDRIVTGYPQDAAEIFESLGYEDKLLCVCEPFAFWAIRADRSVADELGFEKAGLPVVVKDDIEPYRKRKVAVLNGLHTFMSCLGLLCGIETVRQCVEDELFGSAIKAVLREEIIPNVDMERSELEEYALQVFERFKNPYIRHELRSITLNTPSKWRARILPQMREHMAKTGKVPAFMALGFAANLVWAEKNGLDGGSWDDIYEEYPLFKEAVLLQKSAIETMGAPAVLKKLLSERGRV